MGGEEDIDGRGGGEQLEHQPWQPATASVEEDLFFSLVCKSRPQPDESRLSGGVIYKLPVEVRRDEVMGSELLKI